MRSASLALSRSSTSVGLPFESLEARMVLSAPTLTPLAPIVSATRVVLPIQYHSDTPIDLTTIGDGDIGVTGPAGFSQLALLVAPPTVLSNGDVVARYAVKPPSGQWNWPSANGTYDVGIAADAVRNTAGEGNAAGGAGSYWFWFNTYIVTLTSQTVTPGTGFDGQFSSPYSDQYDRWDFSLHLATPYQRAGGNGASLIHITGPNGYDATQLAAPGLFDYYRETRTDTDVRTSFAAPGGTWDYSDSGDYTVQIGTPNTRDPTLAASDVAITQHYHLSFTGPRAQLVSTAVRQGDMLITVRYDAPGGVRMSTIGNGDVSLVLQYDQARFGQYNTDIVASLFQAPVVNSDGSVTAVYRAGAPSSAWSSLENSRATVVFRAGQVLTNSGAGAGAAALGSQHLSFAGTSVQGLRTLSRTSTAWDVELLYFNPGQHISTSSLGSQNLAVSAPGGRTVRVVMISFANSSDQVLHVRYRILAATNGGTLARGTYGFSLRSGSVFAAGVALPGQFITSVTI